MANEIFSISGRTQLIDLLFQMHVYGVYARTVINKMYIDVLQILYLDWCNFLAVLPVCRSSMELNELQYTLLNVATENLFVLKCLAETQLDSNAHGIWIYTLSHYGIMTF